MNSKMKQIVLSIFLTVLLCHCGVNSYLIGSNDENLNETNAVTEIEIEALLDHELGLIFYKDHSIPACIMEKVPDFSLQLSEHINLPDLKIPLPSDNSSLHRELDSNEGILTSELGKVFCNGLTIVSAESLLEPEEITQAHQSIVIRTKRQTHNGYYRSSGAQSNSNVPGQASQAQVQGQVFGRGFFSGQAQSQNGGLSQSQVQLAGVGISGQIASSSGNAQAQLALGSGAGSGQASGLGQGPSNSQVQVNLGQNGEETMASASATSGGASAGVGNFNGGAAPSGSGGGYYGQPGGFGVAPGYGYYPGSRGAHESVSPAVSAVPFGGGQANGFQGGSGGAPSLQHGLSQPGFGVGGVGHGMSGGGVGSGINGGGLSPGMGGGSLSPGMSGGGLGHGIHGNGMGPAMGGGGMGPAMGGGGMGHGIHGNGMGPAMGGGGMGHGIHGNGMGPSMGGGDISGNGLSGITPGVGIGGSGISQGTIGQGSGLTGMGGGIPSTVHGTHMQPGLSGYGPSGTGGVSSGLSGTGTTGRNGATGYTVQSPQGTHPGSFGADESTGGANGKYGVHGSGPGVYAPGYRNGVGGGASGRPYAHSQTPGAVATTYGMGQAQAQTVYFGSSGNGQYAPVRYDQSSQPGSGVNGNGRYQDQQVGYGKVGQRQQTGGPISGQNGMSHVINGGGGNPAITNGVPTSTHTLPVSHQVGNGGLRQNGYRNGYHPTGNGASHIPINGGINQLSPGGSPGISTSGGQQNGFGTGDFDATHTLGPSTGIGTDGGKTIDAGIGTPLITGGGISQALPDSQTGYTNGIRQTQPPSGYISGPSVIQNGRNGNSYRTNGYSQQIPSQTHSGVIPGLTNTNGKSYRVNEIGQVVSQPESRQQLRPGSSQDFRQGGFSPSYGVSNPSVESPDGKKCTIITFSCTIVIESNGRAKICKPNAVKMNGNGQHGTNGNGHGGNGSKVCCC